MVVELRLQHAPEERIFSFDTLTGLGGTTTAFCRAACSVTDTGANKTMQAQ